jgi:hypothetical protein
MLKSFFSFKKEKKNLNDIKNCNCVETEIVINENNLLQLNEMLIFPHGYDGLHLWEAGIILGRWIYYNNI